MHILPPFHRRILPWIFVSIFCAAAPALVFYTAGYRWNTKKDKVERNGTLIIDSKPRGARVLLNGTIINDTTPVTLPNTTPGQYLLRVDKDGYSAWQKYLDIRPEYVTFANHIWLWKLSQPTFLHATPVAKFKIAPDQKTVALLSIHPTSTSISMWQPTINTTSIRILPAMPNGTIALSWSPDSQSLFIENVDALMARAWIIPLQEKKQIISLPQGFYRWNQEQLEGVSSSNLITVDVVDGHLTKMPLPPLYTDQRDDAHIQHTSETTALVLFQKNDPNKGLILPSGNWSFVDLLATHALLRSNDAWLSINRDVTSPEFHRAYGDELRIFQGNSGPQYILVQGGELWLWDPKTEPTLLLRESEPIVQAEWHHSGENILFATAHTVTILNLDSRDGRSRTPIATFDHIEDLALLNKKILIAGTKNEQSGVWSIDVE